MSVSFNSLWPSAGQIELQHQLCLGTFLSLSNYLPSYLNMGPIV